MLCEVGHNSGPCERCASGLLRHRGMLYWVAGMPHEGPTAGLLLGDLSCASHTGSVAASDVRQETLLPNRGGAAVIHLNGA